MRASVSVGEEAFARLRHRIAEIEGRPIRGDFAMPERQSPPSPLAGEGWGGGYGHGSDVANTLPLAVPPLDRMLAGGLRRDALHELRSETTRDVASATGFAAALIVRLATVDRRPVLWVAEASALSEAGLPYGAGLDRFGTDSSRLILVRVRKPAEALWVFEEGLTCRGLAAVLTEIRGNPRPLDLTATRRLALRAEAGGVMGLLLRQSAAPDATAAETRWSVAPLPAGVTDDYPAGIGRPAWRLTLERNRHGPTGTADVEWDHDRRAFACLEADRPAHPRSVAVAPVDRPHPASAPRSLVA
jgi:protein ImuA